MFTYLLRATDGGCTTGYPSFGTTSCKRSPHVVTLIWRSVNAVGPAPNSSAPHARAVRSRPPSLPSAEPPDVGGCARRTHSLARRARRCLRKKARHERHL